MKQILFLLIGACLLQVIFAADYDYDESSGKGPKEWAKLFPNYCGKSSQSPINIVSKNATYDSSLNEISLTGYKTIPTGPSLQIGNNGHSFRVIVKPNTFSISGGDLKGTYHLHSFHLHWGDVNSRGSEHNVDGKMYSAELHLVHFNNKYGNLSNSIKEYDGLAVLGIMLEVGSENAALQSFLKYAINVTKPKELYNVTQTQALYNLLPVNVSDYYRYHGSLTTPNCSESVTWTVFKNVAQISSDQLKLLRSLEFKNGKGMADNHRPVQPLNGRTVKSSTKQPVEPTPSIAGHIVTNTMTVVIAIVMATLFN